MKWENINGKLTREFTFKDFNEVIAFINKIAPICEEKSHHPDIQIYKFNQLKVELITHDIDAISEKDFALAKSIDDAFER